MRIFSSRSRSCMIWLRIYWSMILNVQEIRLSVNKWGGEGKMGGHITKHWPMTFAAFILITSNRLTTEYFGASDTSIIIVIVFCWVSWPELWDKLQSTRFYYTHLHILIYSFISIKFLQYGFGYTPVTNCKLLGKQFSHRLDQPNFTETWSFTRNWHFLRIDH